MMHEDRKRNKYGRVGDEHFHAVAMGSLGFVGDEMLSLLSFMQDRTPAFYWPVFINRLKKVVLDYVVFATTEHPFA